MSLFDDIGKQKIEIIVRSFYDAAFIDPIISHHFFNSDKEQLIASQIKFVTGFLGGPRDYQGKDLKSAHRRLPINNPQFGRRQVLMREAMDRAGLDPDLAKAWLEREEKLRPLIVTGKKPCNR